MNRIPPLVLLSLWREACQHIKLDESAAAMLRILQAELPVVHLALRRFDEQPNSLLTLTHTDPAQVVTIGQRQVLTVPESRKLGLWTKAGQPLSSKRGQAALIRILEPHPEKVPGVVVPLVLNRRFKGCLLLYLKDGTSLNARQWRLIEQLSEPFVTALSNDELLQEIHRLREAAEADKGALLRRLGRTDLGDTIIGENTGIRPVMERVKRVVDSDVPVLILGETGTGKELIARALHVRGKRGRGPFIRVNCGAIPPELIDAQLFGHEKGSFTGANQERAGWFERADGGTLFLDEIGELPLEAQVRFLRVLQDGFLERVGGQQLIHVDVRVIAATHRDLPTMIREGRFREDLWYRLAVFPVLLPPLRERLNDLGELANFFAERAAARFGLSPVYPTAGDVRLLQSYHWPGNIRELGAVIDRAAILGNGERLEIATSLGNVGANGFGEPGGTLRLPSETRTTAAADSISSLDQAIRSHIERALILSEGRIEGRHGAARLLQINPHTLRARMRKLKIDWSQFRRRFESE